MVTYFLTGRAKKKKTQSKKKKKHRSPWRNAGIAFRYSQGFDDKREYTKTAMAKAHQKCAGWDVQEHIALTGAVIAILFCAASLLTAQWEHFTPRDNEAG